MQKNKRTIRKNKYLKRKKSQKTIRNLYKRKGGTYRPLIVDNILKNVMDIPSKPNLIKYYV